MFISSVYWGIYGSGFLYGLTGLGLDMPIAFCFFAFARPFLQGFPILSYTPHDREIMGMAYLGDDTYI